jgi:hypothetical protein
MRFFRENLAMAIEWQKVERAEGVFADWLAVADGPEGTEIHADYGPISCNRTVYQVAWRGKTVAWQAATSQLSVQLVVEGYAPTERVAKAKCERLIEALQQITQDSPGVLQTLHQAAT